MNGRTLLLARSATAMALTGFTHLRSDEHNARGGRHADQCAIARRDCASACRDFARTA